MTVHLDTSALVDALTGRRRSLPQLTGLVERGDRPVLSSLVLYEWLRGPRRPEELEAQARLFPPEAAVPFGAAEAALAGDLYTRVRRARGREIDLAIAACAIAQNAALWTLNQDDFRDVPRLTLI